MAGIVYLLNVSSPNNVQVSVDKIQTPPAVVLATVRFHTGTVSNEVKSSLKQKYPEAYHEDHFGPSHQYQDAWKILCRLLDNGQTGVSVQVVIRSLKNTLESLQSRMHPSRGSRGV